MRYASWMVLLALAVTTSACCKPASKVVRPDAPTYERVQPEVVYNLDGSIDWLFTDVERQKLQRNMIRKGKYIEALEAAPVWSAPE